ncbi:MAG: acyl-CoA thioesterase II [Pseudomonadota bacterium]
MSDENATPDQSALANLIALLDLEQIEQNLFRAQSQATGWQRVYGGQVLGQALVAAVRTVEPERHVHSMHAYFLLGGDPNAPIVYDVERIRDGGSFNTRRVIAIQHGRPIFTMSASFHKHEPGFSHQDVMPHVPEPDDLPSEREIMMEIGASLSQNMQSYLARERPIEMRPVDTARYQTRAPMPARQMTWMRANGSMPDDPKLHQCALAYASDFTLLDTALIAHGKLLFDHDIQLASLDHAMWMHRPFRMDEWLLYVQDSPTGEGARSFCRGSVFARDGRLVASTTQEGLTRPRGTDYVVS